MSFIRVIFMTVQLVTSAAARPPCAPRAAACGCRGCPPETLLSGSSGGGSRQNPDTTQHILLIKLSIISDKATWPCLVTQCLSTDSTLMVAAELVMDIFLLAASRNESLEAFWSMKQWTRILRSLSQSFIFLTIFGRSRGLLEPAVAAAKATAAGAKLDLQCFNANKGRLVLVHPFHSNTGM